MADEKDNLRLEEISGLGEKKAQQLHEELGINTVQELLEAIDSGEVAELDGFGAKTIENLRQAIEDLRVEEEQSEEEVIEEEAEEEIILEESSENLDRPIIVDNRYIDRLFTDASARVTNKYEHVIVVADKHYVREKRINFLFALVMRMLKQGGIVKFPEDFFESFPDAKKKDGYWIIEKGE